MIPAPANNTWMPDPDGLIEPAPRAIAFDEQPTEAQLLSAAWVRKTRQPERPWTGEMVLEIFHEYKRNYQPKEFAPGSYEKFKTMGRAALSKAAATKEQYKKVIMYLFQISTSTQANELHFSFLIDWLGVTKENGYKPVPWAKAEVERVAATWDRQQSAQRNLF